MAGHCLVISSEPRTVHLKGSLYNPALELAVCDGVNLHPYAQIAGEILGIAAKSCTLNT